MTGPSLEQRFADRMGALLGPDFPQRVCLSVSGGGDSMALLALAHGWARRFGVRLHVATIDHGLRDGSAAEAELVAGECAALGHRHDTLAWHWDGTGNLQEQARLARLRLLDHWRPPHAPVLMGHTQDDQAETVLMRLTRGGGVDALAGMAEDQTIIPPPDATAARGVSHGPLRIARPLLNERRADLRHYVQTLRVPFVDDPSNSDTRFERVRLRQVMGLLTEAGFDLVGAARSATKMRRASHALWHLARTEAAGCVFDGHVDWPQAQGPGGATGDVWLDRRTFAALAPDTRLRLFRAAITWIGGAGTGHPPRETKVDARLDAALSGGGGTLNGTRIVVSTAAIHLFREYGAVRDVQVPATNGALWDGRWRIRADARAPFGPRSVIRPLGPDGWTQLPERIREIATHDLSLSLPALFEGDTLTACAPLRHGPAVTELITPFHAYLGRYGQGGA